MSAVHRPDWRSRHHLSHRPKREAKVEGALHALRPAARTALLAHVDDDVNRRLHAVALRSVHAGTGAQTPDSVRRQGPPGYQSTLSSLPPRLAGKPAKCGRLSFTGTSASLHMMCNCGLKTPGGSR